MATVEVNQLGEGIVQVLVRGEVDHSQASDVFQIAVMELHDCTCEKMVIDLRQTRLLDQFSIFKIYKLLHMFNQAVLADQHRVVISVLYNGDEDKKEFLQKTVNDDGMLLRFFDSRDNALRWFNDPMGGILQ